MSVGEQSLGVGARATEKEPLTPEERAELSQLRKRVSEIELYLQFI